MFIGRRRLNRLEGDVESLRRELDRVRFFLDVNREGQRCHPDQPTLRELYRDFERGHTLRKATPREWED